MNPRINQRRTGGRGFIHLLIYYFYYFFFIDYAKRYAEQINDGIHN